MTGQLPLDLAFPPSFDRADFIADDGNRAALAWIDRWPDWPGPALILVAPAGCGKTHLLNIWCARSAARRLDIAALRRGDGGLQIAIDDAEAIAGDAAAEEALFHLYNRLAAARGSLLLTARTPPARWPIGLRDLASRLRAAAVAEIAAPSDELLETIIAKLCSDRRLVLGPRVLQYVVRRIERSADAARRIVAALDRQAMADKGAVTLERARGVLAAEGMEG